MRRISSEEVQSWYINHNPDGLNMSQVRLKLEKAAALEALRLSNNLAHLKPVLAWMIEVLIGIAMKEYGDGRS